MHVEGRVDRGKGRVEGQRDVWKGKGTRGRTKGCVEGQRGRVEGKKTSV